MNKASSRGFSPQLEQTANYYRSCAADPSVVLATGSADAMLNELKEEVIKSIKDLEFICLNCFLQYRAAGAEI